MRGFTNHIGLLLACMILLSVGIRSHSSNQHLPNQFQVFENNRLLIVESHPRVANSANTSNEESENMEKCDNELVHIIANHGSSFFTMCLETDENDRIKSFHYNSYHEDTNQFQSRKTFDEDQLKLNDCPTSNEVNTFDRQGYNNLERYSRTTDHSYMRDNFNENSCTSARTVDIVSMIGINFLSLEISQFSADQGGHLQFSYRSNPFDFSHEKLNLRLFKRNDEWMLGDANDDRIVTFDVELKKIWLFKPVVVGIKNINPMYEEDLP